MPNPLLELFPRDEIPSASKLEQVVLTLIVLRKRHPDARTQGYYDRLQRSCSWLAKAKQVAPNPEAEFIFAWIALNALCGIRYEVLNKTDWLKRELRSCPPIGKHSDDKDFQEMRWFFWRVCGLDNDGRVLRDMLERNWSDVRSVLRSRYLMPNLWTWMWKTQRELESGAETSEKIVKSAIDRVDDRKKRYQALCEIIIWRLRILRNQLFHGCATDTHSKRRIIGESELETGTRLVTEFVWAFLVLMASEAGRTRYWPPIPYPRAGSAQHQPFDASWLNATE